MFTNSNNNLNNSILVLWFVKYFDYKYSNTRLMIGLKQNYSRFQISENRQTSVYKIVEMLKDSSKKEIGNF